MVRYQSINRSRKAVWICLLFYFLMMLALNHFTNYVADDWVYMFSFVSEDRMPGVMDMIPYTSQERIQSIRSIIPSMIAHAQGMNARLICHGLVQLLLMMPKQVFNLLNSLVYCSTVYNCYRICRAEKEPDVLLLNAVFMCFFCFLPCFGQQCLWLDGSVNYLWALWLATLYLKPFLSFYRGGQDSSRSVPAKILFCVFSVILGLYTEVVSVAAIFLSFLLLVFSGRGRKGNTWLRVSLISAGSGYCILVTNPTELTNKGGSLTLGSLLEKIREITFECTNHYLLLLTVWTVLMVVMLYLGKDRKTLLLSALFVLAAFAGAYSMVFAQYFVERCLGATSLFLTAACGILLDSPAQSYGDGPRWSRLPLSACSAMLSFLFLSNAVLGGYDVWYTSVQYHYREEMIYQQLEQGIRDVRIPVIYGSTTYSCYIGLRDLDTEDASRYPNSYMAAVYGADSILGEGE